MKFGILIIRVFALFLASLACCLGQRTYTATPIAVPAYDVAYLIWISDDGKTGFGAGQTVSPYLTQCFTYQNGTSTSIATPGQYCSPLAANAGAYLFYVTPPTPPFSAQPAPPQLFAYKNAQFNLLLPPDGTNLYSSGGLTAVNPSGQFAITLLCPAPAGFTGLTVAYKSVFCPYSVSTSGVFARLPGDQGGHAYASAINANGDIAGFVSPPNADAVHSTPLPIAGNLVVWPQGGGVKIIGNPANLLLGIPVAINSKGQIAGPGYIYDGVSTIAPLKITGAVSTLPISMNEAGEIVGLYRASVDNGIAAPFYYVNGTAVDLNALVTDLPKDRVLSQVWYINNAGQILVTVVDISQPVGAVANGTAAKQYLLTPKDPLTTPLISRVVSAASFEPGTASSALVTILGLNLSSTTRQWASSDFVGGKLPTSLDGVSVAINGVVAYPNYISPTQINVLAPDDSTTGPVQVQVTNSKGTSNSFTSNKSDPMPGFFTVGSKPYDLIYRGGYYVAALHGDGTPVGPPGLVAGVNFTPAKQGEEIQLFGTGFGATTPAAPAGQLLTAPVSLSNQVTVLIDGKPAQVIFADRVANGLDQINVIVPNVFPDGDVVVQAKVNGVTTQTNLFLTVKF